MEILYRSGWPATCGLNRPIFSMTIQTWRGRLEVKITENPLSSEKAKGVTHSEYVLTSFIKTLVGIPATVSTTVLRLALFQLS